MSLTSFDADLDFLSRSQLDLLAPLTDASKDGALPVLEESAGGVQTGAVEDFDVSFLSDFLMDEPALPDPSTPPTTSGSDSDSPVMATSTELAIPGMMFNPFEFHQPSVPGSPSPSTSSSSSSDHNQLVDVNADNKDESPEDRKARRRAQVAVSARRHRTRKKNEMMELRKQVGALNSHLEFLRSKHKLLRSDGAVAEWEERAMAMRHKRRQAEDMNEQLKRALFVQRGFVRDLKSVFSNSPMFSSELNMRYLLHTYTRLGKNPRSRFRDYQSICTNAKLDMALQIVTRETEAISFDSPSFATRKIQAEANEFGMTTVAVYSFETLDINKIFVATCSAILTCGSDWPHYTLVSTNARVIDSPASHIRYGVSDAKYKSDASGEELLVEGRGISYYRITDSYAMLLWDYVDVDDLYPLQEETDLKRDVIGAVLVRQEMCDDGVERVVCRNICTKIHSLGKPRMSQDVMRFSQNTILGAKACSCRVYKDIMKDGMGEHVST